MSRFKYKKIRNEVVYNNVLTSLGLSKIYILYNNYLYFGKNELVNQDIINDKIKKILKEYDDFYKKIVTKYDKTSLVHEICNIFNKLQTIHIKNDEYLNKNDDLSEETIKNVSYPSKAADLMARKAKLLIEKVVYNDNNNRHFYFTNRDYRKLVILLYYYSIFIFFKSKSLLSKNYENGITNYYINPNSLEPINTYNENQKNSINKNGLQFNYNAEISNIINKDFDNAFYKEKGISFNDYKQLIESLRDVLSEKKKNTLYLNKNKFLDYVYSNYKINKKKFEQTCIYKKEYITIQENDLYKNNSKYRLDTTPIIQLEEDKYIINDGLLFNSYNFWNNICSIGLKPYSEENNTNDSILKESDNIIRKVTKLFEKDVRNKLLTFNNDFQIYSNKRTNEIFKNTELDDNEWDIIAVDHNKKIIFDIETKFISTSMTESSLANDMKKISGNGGDNYINKFEKRISIEKDNIKDFLTFCKANENYKIVRIMVTSKTVDFNIDSPDRNFSFIHYEGLELYLNNIYKKEI